MVARPGTSSTGCSVVRPPRSASVTSPGTTTVPVPRGANSLRESSSSAGVAASSGSTVRRAPSVVASPPAATTCSSIARAGADSSASRARTSSCVGSGEEQGRSPLTPASGPPVSPSATPLSGRSPPVDSHARARSTSRSTAAATASGWAFTRSVSRSGDV